MRYDNLYEAFRAVCDYCGVQPVNVADSRSAVGAIVKQAMVILNVKMTLCPPKQMQELLCISKVMYSDYLGRYSRGTAEPLAVMCAQNIHAQLCGERVRKMELFAEITRCEALGLSAEQLVLIQQIINKW